MRFLEEEKELILAPGRYICGKSKGKDIYRCIVQRAKGNQNVATTWLIFRSDL
jgi:hypothetical protein